MTTIVREIDITKNPEDPLIWGITATYSEDPTDTDIVEAGSKQEMQLLYSKIKGQVEGKEYSVVIKMIDEVLHSIREGT